MLAGVRAIAAALAMVSLSFAAVAQVVPPGAQIVPPSGQPGRERERFERPPVPLAQPGGPAISVPGIEAPPGAAETTLVIRQIRIVGATVYTAAQLAEVYADLIGKTVTLQALYDLAQRITAKYGGDGYVLSRAIVPVQELDPNGAVVKIQVVEGYIETVEWPPQLSAPESPPSDPSISAPSSAIYCWRAIFRGSNSRTASSRIRARSAPRSSWSRSR